MATDPNQVLTGWKAIAGFLKRDERTAMRWAAERGLPVRRVPGGKRGPVYAVPDEIARWLANAAERSDRDPGDPPGDRRDSGATGEMPRRPPPDLPAPDAGSAAIAPTPAAGGMAGPRRLIRPASVAALLAAVLAGAGLAVVSIEQGLLPIDVATARVEATCASLADADR